MNMTNQQQLESRIKSLEIEALAHKEALVGVLDLLMEHIKLHRLDLLMEHIKLHREEVEHKK